MSAKYIKKDINLILSYRKKPVQIEKKSNQAGKILTALILSAIMLTAFGYYFIKSEKLENEIDDINSFFDNSDNMESLEQSKELYSIIIKKSDMLNKLQSEIPEKYYFDSRTAFEKLYTTLEGKLLINEISYSSEQNMLSVKLSTKNAVEINSYIKRLEATGLFIDVDYTGYVFMDDSGEYEFTTNAFLKQRGV